MTFGHIGCKVATRAAPGSAGVGPGGLTTAYGWWLLTGAAVSVAAALTRSARPARQEAPRHVARRSRGGAKVRPVSG